MFLSAVTSAAEQVPVTIKPLDQLWRPQQHNAPAQALSLNEPNISAEISAAVLKTLVNVGDIVSKNDVLVKLDCESYEVQRQINQANLERSNAQLAFARRQLARANNLKKKKSISEELLDQRRTEVKIAVADQSLQQQNLGLSSINVDDCNVRAPFSAVITDRMVSTGDYVNIGQALVSIVDLGAIEIEADLHHAEIRSLQQADKIVFSYEGLDFAVAVKNVVRVFDYQSATAKVRLSFEHEIKPWPGSEGRLKWRSKQALLPAAYLTRRGEQLGVFHVVDGKAEFTVLENAIEGRPAKIALPGSSLIVMEGRHRLNHGDVVSVASKP